MRLEMRNIIYKIISVQEKEIWPLEEVKNYLRVSHKNDDKLITNLVHSSIDYAEQFLGISFFTKKISCSVEVAPKNFRAKYIPLITLTKVSVIDKEQQEDITNDFGYISSDHETINISSKYWNRKLQIEYDAGWGDNIPRAIMYGSLMHVSMMYDLGEMGGNISSEIRDMYLPYRRVRV